MLNRLTIAAAVSSDELFTLREMGFDVRPVSTATLNAGFDLSRADVLFVSAGLNYAQLNAAAKAEVAELLTRGGVVTRGATGSKFNADAGLLDGHGQVRPGRRERHRHGRQHRRQGAGRFAAERLRLLAAVVQRAGGGVTVEQRYGTGNPLVAGHWLPDEEGNGGPDQASGQALTVSGADESGARVLLFGSEPMFRNHPKGMFGQVANAVFWSATR